MPRAFIRPVSVPGLPTRTIEVEYNDYSKGMNSYIANDALDDKYWRLAKNGRMPTLGEYETRKGTDFHSAATGNTLADSEESLTGTADQSFDQVNRLSQKFTIASDKRLSYITLRLKNDASATGNIKVSIHANEAGLPGDLLTSTTISASELTDSYVYRTAYFDDARLLITGDYHIVLSVQPNGIGSYKVSSTTNSTDATTSDDSGVSWTVATYSLNFTLFTCTDESVTGLTRAYKTDGTAKTLYTAGTTLYSVNDTDGALTSVRTGLNANMTYWRSISVNDIIYHVNGLDGLRKWNFTTESQVVSNNYSHIALHKGLLFLVDKDDPNKLIFSNFGEYEVFTSTDFIYVPAPKTGDPITAIYPLNGSLVVQTRFNKYILYGTDNATFQLEQATGTKGTFSQESVSYDANFAYFTSDDGVYRFNGTVDELISKSNYEDIKGIVNKDKSIVCVNKGRLYVWFPSASNSFNSLCWVYNLNFDALESFDTDSYVSRAITTTKDDNKLLVGSSLTGSVSWQELATNDYSNKGQGYEFRLQTHNMHFGTPSRNKEIRFWKPRFETSDGNYTITCEYATDLRDNFQSRSNPNTQGSGYVWGASGTIWGAFTWGSTKELQSDLNVAGDYRRIAVAYTHSEPRQPHKFLGHTFVAEMRDLR